MGLYLRKSLSVGPFRFNLSKSGIGVSAGVRGARVGTGPRGNYVHVGRAGFYYRASLNGGTRAKDLPPHPLPAPSVTASDGLAEIDSGSLAEMRDSSSAELLDEINAKMKRGRLEPWAWGAGVSATVAAALAGAPPVVLAAALAATVAVALLVRGQDRIRRTVVLMYDFAPNAEERYAAVHEGFDRLAECERAWHIEASGDVVDRKRAAGASEVVRRKTIGLAKSPPAWLATNVEVPTIPVGRQSLIFLPDFLLVVGEAGAGAVPYAQLEIEREQARFIEGEQLPSDAEVVDRTWKYVNKKGGPDRRFNDNRELPIALYESLHLRSPSGLNELVEVSRAGSGKAFEAALRAMGAR